MASCSSANYESERALVEDFVRALRDGEDLWGGGLDFAEEFYYLRGRTDIVALNSSREVIAFEAKLEDWKVAMHQAYRNTCFAHLSYVVLPEYIARRAVRAYAEFSRRGVGVCTIEGAGISILHPARRRQPLQGWLSKLAAEHISTRRCHEC